MHALGRHFQVGDLYDYRNDCILIGETLQLIFNLVNSLNLAAEKFARKRRCLYVWANLLPADFIFH